MEVLPIPGKTLIDSSAILESITATLVPPSLVQQLSKEDIIGIPADCYADYIYDEEFGALTVLAQSNVAIVIRVMCSPFKHLKKLLENQLIFDLKLTVNSQYREYSESFLAKLRIKAPIVEHTLYVHGEVGTDA